MSAGQRGQLELMARSSSLPNRQVVQARALLLAADGVATNEVARRCATSNTSVRAWRRNFTEQGVAGVGRIAAGRGRKSCPPTGTVAAVVADTQQNKPDDGSTHWTTRLMAERHGIGKDSVARIWRDHDLKPWKVDTFKVLRSIDGEPTPVLHQGDPTARCPVAPRAGPGEVSGQPATIAVFARIIHRP